MTLEALRAVDDGRAFVMAGAQLPLSEGSEPEPDVMVRTSALSLDVRLEDVLLWSRWRTSLRTDQTVKAALYASHGISEYLLLDVANRRAEIRRKPRAKALVLTEDGEFTPVDANGPLRVADLLAPPKTAR